MSSAMNVGVWRDRTNLFISYRQSYTHHPAKRIRPNQHGRFSDNPDTDNERAGLMSNVEGDGDAVIEMDLLPPRWLDIQDEITAQLADVTRQMKKLEQLHATHVLPGFDDEKVKAREEREIEGITNEITKSFSSCQRAIKRIDSMLREQQQHSPTGTINDADKKMAKNLQISLAARVGDVSSLFRKRQSAYLKKLRSLGGMSSPLDNAPRSGTPSSLAQNPYTDPAMLDEQADRASAQTTLQQTAQVRRRTGVHDSAIAQREQEIEKIAQGVLDLANIFQELNSMVIDQGSLLDRIDYNVERTAEHVKAAEKELVVATGYQKKSTKRKIILLLVLLVVGMFVLLLVKPRRSSGGDGAVVAPPSENPAQAVPNQLDAGLEGEEIGANGLPEGLTDVVQPNLVHRRAEWKQRRRR